MHEVLKAQQEQRNKKNPTGGMVVPHEDGQHVMVSDNTIKGCAVFGVLCLILFIILYSNREPGAGNGAGAKVDAH